MASSPSSGVPSLISTCRELYEAIDRLDQRAADRVGVSRNDLRALNLLERGPQRAGELAAQLGLTSGAMTTLIDRLEKTGLATRTRDPADRRVVLVAPTDRLFKEVGGLYRQVAGHLTSLAERYTAQELEVALRHLREIIAAYESATDDSESSSRDSNVSRGT
ncbi:MAG: MarR family transcriptional regulator [Myxococcota bacterium]